jgi:hypothetical protein
MELSADVRSEMEASKTHLGAAEAPEGVKAGTEGRIERAIDEAFVAGLRVVMLVSAGLALASALVAALFVSDRRVRPPGRDSMFHLQVGVGGRGPAPHATIRGVEATREGRDTQPIAVNPTRGTNDVELATMCLARGVTLHNAGLGDLTGEARFVVLLWPRVPLALVRVPSLRAHPARTRGLG